MQIFDRPFFELEDPGFLGHFSLSLAFVVHPGLIRLRALRAMAERPMKLCCSFSASSLLFAAP